MSQISGFAEVEEGEVNADVNLDDIYIPLERPVHNDAGAPRFAESNSDDMDASSSSDSDSSVDGENGPQRKKNKRVRCSFPKPEKNKLKIWCHVLEDESISNNLTDCNLDESQMRIRGLLPYNRNDNSNAGKRNHAGHFVNERKYFKNNQKTNIGYPKNIPALSDDAGKTDDLLAAEIAKKLNEVKEDLILRAIQVAGKDKIIPIFEDTRKIEKCGGMLVMNGSRRRASGGVFFYQLKTSKEIPHEQIKEIFRFDKQGKSGKDMDGKKQDGGGKKQDGGGKKKKTRKCRNRARSSHR